MIKNWRLDWGQGDFPFFFVQLANFRAIKEAPAESNWAELREAQQMTLSLPNTGTAVIIDIGETKFVWANAEIDGQNIVVWSKEVKDPVAVRYAWADNPICNLYNGADLPASPFRTDDWPGITADKH